MTDLADAEGKKPSDDGAGRELPAPRRVRPLSERVLRAALLIGGVGALLFSHIPLCPVALGLHQPCPGCGLTRASKALLHGDLADAYAYHPLVFAVLPLFGAWLGFALYEYLVRGVASPPPRVGKALTPLLAALWVALLVLWILRWRGHFGGPVAV